MAFSHRVGLAALLWTIAAGQAWAQSAPPAKTPAAKTSAAAAAMSVVTVYTKEKPPAAPKLEDLPLKESVSQFGITWTFERPARVGQFINGDWYVVGETIVKAIDPKPLWDEEVKDANATIERKADGKYLRNGSVLNMKANDPVGTAFDSRSPRYSSSVRTNRPPIAMKPGDALVSTITEGRLRPGSGSSSSTKSVAVLTCLKEPVPADAFRPGYTDRDQKIYLSRNLRRELLATLPRIPKTPEISESVAIFQGPWLEVGGFGADVAPYEGEGYGAAIARSGGTATLQLNLDFKPEEKERLLVSFMQYGLDLWSLLKNGHPGWQAWGGWGAGRKWPIVFTGLMLNDPQMASPEKAVPKAVFQEDMQTMFDDCWTGAGVVYCGHVGKDGHKGDFGWGAFENLPPSRWPGDWDYPIGNAYRVNSTQENWIGQALAARIMNAEEAWSHDAYFVEMDRWMTEPDPGYGTDAAFAVQGHGKVQFQVDLWHAYREHLPSVAGKEVKPRPDTLWQKTREMKSVPVAVEKRAFRMAGQPFFPLMMFAEHPKRIEQALAIGVNTIAEGSFESPKLWNAHVNNRDFLDKLAEKKLYGVFGGDMRAAGHPALLGWIHMDEPDRLLDYTTEERNTKNFLRQKNLEIHPFMWMRWALTNDPQQKGKDEVLVVVGPTYRWMKKVDATRPVFLTVGPAFFKAATENKELAAEYLKTCEAVGCKVPAAQIGESVAKLRELAGADKAVYAWIETRGAKPEEVRAAVRSAISKGAAGIGYRGFEGYGDEKPDDAVMAELKKVNDQITAHAAELLANPSKAEDLLK
jgi:hypothetical protein